MDSGEGVRVVDSVAVVDSVVGVLAPDETVGVEVVSSPGVGMVSPGVAVVSPGAAVMVVWSVVEQAVLASISAASSMAAKLLRWWLCGMGVVLGSFDADGAVVMVRVVW